MKHLLEMATWSESREGGRASTKLPGKWIHFTNGIFKHKQRAPIQPKLGIKPECVHGDPLGIYFYPTSWIVNQSSHQYAVLWRFYYIVEILPEATIIDLQKITLGELKEPGLKAGWWDTFRADTTWMVGSKLNDDTVVGTAFYKFLTHNNQRKIQSAIVKSLKCDGIVDKAGIIHPDEPHQLVMFNQKMFKVVDMGKNKNHANSELYKTIETGLQDELIKNVRLEWKNKKIDMTFDYKDVNCHAVSSSYLLPMVFSCNGWNYGNTIYLPYDVEGEYTASVFKASVIDDAERCHSLYHKCANQFDDVLSRLPVTRKTMTFQGNLQLKVDIGDNYIKIGVLNDTTCTIELVGITSKFVCYKEMPHKQALEKFIEANEALIRNGYLVGKPGRR